jgi:hypothetical protein
MFMKKWLQGRTATVGLLLGLVGLLGSWTRAEENLVETRMRKDVFFLASDECEGRGIETKGINLAADHIAAEFKKAGLKPLTKDGSYFQPFTMTGMGKLESPNTLALLGPQGQEVELPMGKQFQVHFMSHTGKATAPLAFIGYAITDKNQAYDDFKDIDVTGKIVMALRRTPKHNKAGEPFDTDHALWITKLLNAQKHHAVGVLFVNDAETGGSTDMLTGFTGFGAPAEASDLPALSIKRSVLDDILRSSLGISLREIEQDIDRDLRPRSAILKGWSARLEVNIHRPTYAVKNVIGVFEGSGPLADETVVIGAHYDHLGYGGFGSLQRNLPNPTIHHGADDNGSGTTGVIELARRFGEQQAKGRQGRRLVFMTFSGEESGLVGSAYYCKHPLLPLDKTVAMVNLDMIGRLRPDANAKKDRVLVEGAGTAKTFDALLDGLAKKYNFVFNKMASGLGGSSDHSSFCRQNVPVIFYWTGYHADYHRPSDTADKINVAGMRRIVDLAEETVSYLATVSERPEFVRVASSAPRAPMDGRPNVSMGIVMDYTAQDKVVIEEVREGRAAAKAGLKAGDRIAEWNGKPVKNPASYTALLAGHKKGDVVELSILRGDQKITIKVTLE